MSFRTGFPISANMVFLVVYKHKHGTDYAACPSEKIAGEVAASWAFEAAVTEDRFDGQFPELIAMGNEGDPDKAFEFLNLYQKCEDETFGTERIEIEELNLLESDD